MSVASHVDNRFWTPLGSHLRSVASRKIADEEIDTIKNSSQVLSLARIRELVEHADVMAPPHQILHDMTTDEPGSARHQYPHTHPSSSGWYVDQSSGPK